MFSSFGPESLSVCAVGVAAVVLGLLALLLAPAQSLRYRWPLLAAVLLALLGGTLALADVSSVVWLPALALAGAAALCALASSPLPAILGQRLATLARQPRG